MTPLTAERLRKSPAYAEEFVKRLKGKMPFSIISGTAVVSTTTLIDNPGVNAVILNGTVAQLKELRFTDGKSHIYRLNQIGRDLNFGGQDFDKTTMGRENAQIGRLRVSLGRLRHNSLNDDIRIQTASGPVEVYNVKDVPPPSTGKLLKADVDFVDAKGKPVLYVSLKKGKKPSDFQQWSGMTSNSGITISNHVEVTQFVKDVLSLYPDRILPNKTIIQRPVKDRDLAMLAVYGPEFGHARGHNNVDMVVLGLGLPSFVASGTNYQINSGKTLYNGDNLYDEYAVVLQATYKGTDRNDFGLRGARFSLSPAGGRGTNTILI